MHIHFHFNAIANTTPVTISEEINQLIKSTGVNLIQAKNHLKGETLK